MIADILTKNLAKDQFCRLRDHLLPGLSSEWGVNEAGSMSAEGAEDVQSNSQATPIAFHAAWTNQGSTNGECRRHALEVVSSRGGESNRFLRSKPPGGSAISENQRARNLVFYLERPAT